MLKKILILVPIALTACSSTPRSVVDMDRIGEEKVLQSFGSDNSLKDAEQFRRDGHRYVSTGFVTIPGDHRPEAGIKLARTEARSLVAKTVDQKLESFLQSSSEGTSGDTLQLREIITESSKLNTSEWMPGKTFYQKVRVVSESGVPRLEYRIWAEISLDEQTFKRHVLEALRAQQDKNRASAGFAKAVDRNFEQLMGGTESHRTPTSAKADNSEEE